MTKQAALFLAALALSGCAIGAENDARTSYVKATDVLNACLLANPGAPAACNAQSAVVQNDLQLYNNLSD